MQPLCKQLMPAMLLLLLLLHAAVAGKMELSNDGRYMNLAIAISPSLAEDWQLIEKLKTALGQMSHKLSLATKPLMQNSARGYSLGEVHILVPKSWKNVSNIDGYATWELADNADLRVGPKINSSSRESFTVQPDGCGRPGKYIFLQAEHLKSNTDIQTLGKELVQRFAELRWGVYREEPVFGVSAMQITGGSVRPVTCTRSLIGEFRNKINGRKCLFNANTATADSDCKFFPSKNQTTRASLMATASVPSVDQFCDSSNSHLQHDSTMQTVQNKMCEGSSIADVIKDSEDFELTRPRLSSQALPMKVTVVRPGMFRKLAIVMDVSGSMKGDKIKVMRKAVQNMIEILENGTQCSLIIFNDSATVIRYPTALNSLSVRNDFKAAVGGLVSDGGTSITSGILEGLKMLRRGSSQQYGFVQLMTDGEDNDSDGLGRAIQRAKAENAICDTISIGNAAADNLKNLSDATGGKSCFAPISKNASKASLSECMTDFVRAFGKDKPITLLHGVQIQI